MQLNRDNKNYVRNSKAIAIIKHVDYSYRAKCKMTIIKFAVKHAGGQGHLKVTK